MRVSSVAALNAASCVLLAFRCALVTAAVLDNRAVRAGMNTTECTATNKTHGFNSIQDYLYSAFMMQSLQRSFTENYVSTIDLYIAETSYIYLMAKFG